MHTDGSAHWKELFMQIMSETDREKLQRLVGEAEAAISVRREELGKSAEAREELSTMAVATEALRSVRVNQLGIGQPGPSNGRNRMSETA